MNKMLKNKYSVIEDLKRYGADKDVDEIKRKVKSMLTNLRFNDGRSLTDVVSNTKMKKQAEEAEAELKAMEEREHQEKLEKKARHEDSRETFSSHRFSTESSEENESADSSMSKDEKDKSSKDGDAEKEDEQAAQDPGRANAELADELLAHKALLKKKREEFMASLDPNLSQQMREKMINDFDNKMNNLGTSIQKEQEEQNAKLLARLGARKRKDKQASLEANENVEDKQQNITLMQERIDSLIMDKEKMKEKGINTKNLKAERDTEYNERMDKLTKEQEEKK